MAIRDLSFEGRVGRGDRAPWPQRRRQDKRYPGAFHDLSADERAVLGGRVPHTNPGAIRPQIGVLPESAGYPLHQSGIEFLQYFARLFGYRGGRAQEIAQELLNDVGLAERAKSPIATYSRGMRQRLGVARALLNAPRVVFLDEPTLGLDPAGQRQILSLIHDVAKERGATVILSTHFLDEVEETCSRVIILNKGEVIAEGTVADIKRKAAPQHGAGARIRTRRRERAQSVAEAGAGRRRPSTSAEGGAVWLTMTFDRASIETKTPSLTRPSARYSTLASRSLRSSSKEAV